MKILLAVKNPEYLAAFGQALAGELGAETLTAATGDEVREAVRSERPTLVVMDEELPDATARKFLPSLMDIDAFVNVAVLTSMTTEEFHEAYEGLGVLMALPRDPGPGEALELAGALRSVTGQ